MVLFDKSDPIKVLGRAQEPPLHRLGKNGQVPNLVFVEELGRDGKRRLLYYGSRDKYVGAASAAVR